MRNLRLLSLLLPLALLPGCVAVGDAYPNQGYAYSGGYGSGAFYAPPPVRYYAPPQVRYYQAPARYVAPPTARWNRPPRARWDNAQRSDARRQWHQDRRN